MPEIPKMTLPELPEMTLPELPEMTLPEFEDCLPKARLELLPGGGRIVCEKCCKPPKPICITTECPPGATSCVGRKRRDAEDRMCYIKPEECGEEKCTPLMIRPRPAPGFIRPDLARPGIDRPQVLPPRPASDEVKPKGKGKEGER